MRATLIQPALTLAILMAGGAAGHSQGADGSWMDAPTIASWNAAGQAIPAAPKVQDPVDPRCRDQARPPQAAEDKQVADRGWDLVGPFQGGWGVVVVRGAAGYDGMCRPLQFQDFVFVHGVFAGTLAPKPMDSRSDGALGSVFLQGPTQLTAQYSRYEKSDPLCCPSRVATVTYEIATDPPVVRARSASKPKTDR